MMHVCTRAFQFRGGILRQGQTADLTEAEAADKFVAAHMKQCSEEEAKRPAPAPVLTNATPVKPKPGNRPRQRILGEED